MTDQKFVTAIKKAGRNGTASFTANQLYAAYASQRKASKGCLLGLIPVSLIALAGGFLANWPLAIFFGGIAMLVVGINGLRSRAMPRTSFRYCTSKWKDAGKSIPGLLEKTSLHEPPQGWKESDIYDYGVERILVVSRDLLVDLLVMNNQHAEHRMLVIAESGYPHYLQPHVTRLLNERTDLPVFLLHDADQKGIELADRVRRLKWLPIGDRQVVDLGFFPADFRKLKRTQNFDNSDSERHLPVDALLMGSLALGLGSCFASQTTFADELLKKEANQAGGEISFG